jgi:hypothetical protein
VTASDFTDGPVAAEPARPTDNVAEPLPVAPEPPIAVVPIAPPGGRGGATIAVAGLAVTGFGIFGLPTQAYGVAGDVGFLQFRHLASVPNADQIMGNAFATFWWRFGLLIALAILVVLVCALVAESVPGGMGWTTAAWAALVCLGYLVGLSQTTDYRSALESLRRGASVLAHAGVGVWVSVTGLAIVAAGGVIAGVSGRRASVVIG